MHDVCVGIDIGGTFTDVVLVKAEGAWFVAKVLTTADDASQAVLAGLDAVVKAAGLRLADVGGIIHGTTLVTNALIERKGAATGLLTTEGFRDSIEIGTESRYDIFDLQLTKPEPLVPRRRRLGVKERVLPDGAVLAPLDEEHARAAIAQLAADGVTCAAVCFLHSYANPAHEIRCRELLAELAPQVRVSISSDVSPEIREYPRSCTTIANVYVQPLVEKYLGRLESALRQRGFSGELLVMQSDGGTASVRTAIEFPIRLLESGPVGGAAAASFYARAHRLGDLVVFDMGGTTAKFSILEDGRTAVRHELEVARAHRFKHGSGIPITIPVIDMIEIGAGGGSIARLDRMGRLRVGPDSAGSDPGPACYGRGGREPTVTDANFLLGYLDPDFFLGGAMAIDMEAGRRAIEERIARPMGAEPTRAALGMLQIVTEAMASAARIHAAERGIDLRKYALFAFGGAGPLHACALADALQIADVIMPPAAGVLSAFGFLTVPLSFEFSRTYRAPLERLDWPRVEAMLAEMEREGRAVLARSLPPAAAVTIGRTCEARYLGQSHYISVPVPDGPLGPHSGEDLKKNFVARYRALYGYDEGAGEDLPIEILTWRLQASGPVPHPALDAGRHGDARVRKPDRNIYFPEQGGFCPVPVLDRYALQPGFAVKGSAVVEERESTFVIPHNRALRVDEFGNLIASRCG